MEILATLTLSFVLSLLFGMERQLSKKPVGFAPYVLVTVMSTSITVVALQVFGSNPSVVNGIITGIGFLGAGALIKYHDKVFGFTTASAVWAMAVLGVIIALADLPVILFTYAMVWAIVGIDRLVENRGFGRHMKTVSVEVKGMGSHADIKEIINKYKDTREESVEMNFDRGIVEYKFLVPAFADVDKMIAEISKLKNMRKIQLD